MGLGSRHSLESYYISLANCHSHYSQVTIPYLLFALQTSKSTSNPPLTQVIGLPSFFSSSLFSSYPSLFPSFLPFHSLSFFILINKLPYFVLHLEKTRRESFHISTTKITNLPTSAHTCPGFRLLHAWALTIPIWTWPCTCHLCTWSHPLYSVTLSPIIAVFISHWSINVLQ